jgi:hypothetical protein
MATCGNCGTANPEGASFCSNCGSALSVAPPPPGVQGYFEPPKKKTPWVWIVLGVAAFLCICPGAILSAILFPAFSAAKQAARANVELSDAKMVAIAVQIYVSDSDNHYPDFSSAGEAADKLQPYLKSGSLGMSARTYGWDLSLSGAAEEEVADPPATWMFHAVTPGPTRKYVVGYADSHVRARLE